jgi:hypothetical protein
MTKCQYFGQIGHLGTGGGRSRRCATKIDPTENGTGDKIGPPTQSCEAGTEGSRPNLVARE